MKAVALNSGGFDSIVMLNHLSKTEGDLETHSLHFKYGARNEDEQEQCVDRVCEKLGIKNVKINLPPFDWSKGDVESDSSFTTSENQYVEWRNLIFLSYALSYAESIGAERIYLNVMSWGSYKDTSEYFLDRFEEIASVSGVSVVTPFFFFDKEDLGNLALRYDITKEDFFSCDYPKKGKPCGECLDCKAIDSIYRDVVGSENPFWNTIRKGKVYPEFDSHMENCPVEEVRVLINDDCQLACSHCFYGDSLTMGNPVSPKELVDSLESLIPHGLKNIHFSGKEPLYDDRIFEYIDLLKERYPGLSYDLVTNGIRLPEVAGRLKEAGVRGVLLSVDAIEKTNLGVRPFSNTVKSIRACREVGLDVRVSVDLHSHNYKDFKDILECLYAGGIRDFYIRTIQNKGYARENFEKLSLDILNDVAETLESFAELKGDCKILLNVGCEYIGDLIREKDREGYLFDMFYFFSEMGVGWDVFDFNFEMFCLRSMYRITVTYDGYILGCPLDVGMDYQKMALGNIRDGQTFWEILKAGRVRELPLRKKFPISECILEK